MRTARIPEVHPGGGESVIHLGIPWWWRECYTPRVYPGMGESYTPGIYPGMGEWYTPGIYPGMENGAHPGYTRVGKRVTHPGIPG